MTVHFASLPARDPKWGPVADACKSRRGEWATVDFPVAFPGAVASNIKSGRMTSFQPAGAFEARQHRYRLWIRYVGPAGEVASA